MDAVLDRIRRAPSIVGVFRLADELVASVAGLPASGPPVDRAHRALVDAMRDSADAPTSIAVVHALAHLPNRADDEWLAELLAADSWLAPHVAWSLAERPQTESLLIPLVELLEAGRLAGMLAQRTLNRWARGRDDTIARILARRLAVTVSPAARARVVETFGLVGGDVRRLIRVAVDSDEPDEARAAAIGALGDRPGDHARVLTSLAANDHPIGDTARLASADLREPDGTTSGPRGDDLRVAQVHLGGRLDRSLAHAGAGDTGGVATLLVQLGDALAADPGIAAVTTIGRGTASEAMATLATAGSPHSVLAAPLGRHEDASFAGGWPALVAAERGLDRILRHRPASVLHLRVADVGSLAAARIARRRNLPFIFTLAPDPHAVIAEMQRTGELDRATFGPADAHAGLWFRARLVRSLADSARRVVLFPRPELASRLRDLVGIDVAADPARYHVVPEGIDVESVAEARRATAAIDVDPPSVVTDLRNRIEALGPGRRGLPLVVSAGRLAEVKGMARIVEAFATDADLRRRANLVIIGGDLHDPNADERDELHRIEAAMASGPAPAPPVVMLGQRRHDDVLRIMAVAEAGDAPWIAGGGVYVCGSRKEEFGLAIVEALAVGLPVVGPRVGGPASYIDDGRTGRLVDTLDPAALAGGIHDALDLAESVGRAEQARHMVATRFTIRAMADALVPIYGTARPARTSVAA